jgi:hypothetical protein
VVYDEAPGELVSSEATTPSGTELVSPGRSTPATDLPSLGASPSAAPVQELGFVEPVDSPQPHVSLLRVDDALMIMPSVLLYCAQQYCMIGKFGHQNIKSESTTYLDNIRSFTNLQPGLSQRETVCSRLRIFKSATTKIYTNK